MASLFDLKNGLYKKLQKNISNQEKQVIFRLTDFSNKNNGNNERSNKDKSNLSNFSPKKTRPGSTKNDSSHSSLFSRKLKKNSNSVIKSSENSKTIKESELQLFLKEILKIIKKVKYIFSSLALLFFYENIGYQFIEIDSKQSKTSTNKYEG